MDNEEAQVCEAEPNMSVAPPAAANEGGGGEGGEGGHESNPVGTGLSVIDYAHLAGDAAIDGGTSATSMGGMATKMAEDGAEVWAGEGTAAQTGMSGATAIAAPLAIAGGAMEMMEGYDQIKDGHALDGGMTMTQGGLTSASGVAGLAGLAGSGAAATAAPLLGAGAAGMALGRFGDTETQRLGWLHDDDGNAEGVSDWMANNGVAADDWVKDHTGSETLGTIAGVGTTIGSAVPGAAMAVGSAIAGGAERLWDWL